MQNRFAVDISMSPIGNYDREAPVN